MTRNLLELYYDQIRFLYSAETQLLNALSEMESYASSPVLREAFSNHLEETQHQVERLFHIAQRHGFYCDDTTCEAMRGLIREATSHMAVIATGNVRDAALIDSANRIEHYEIAGYGVAKCCAACLGFVEDRDVLDATLNEESKANKTLTRIATAGRFSSRVFVASF